MIANAQKKVAEEENKKKVTPNIPKMIAEAKQFFENEKSSKKRKSDSENTFEENIKRVKAIVCQDYIDDATDAKKYLYDRKVTLKNLCQKLDYPDENCKGWKELSQGLNIPTDVIKRIEKFETEQAEKILDYWMDGGGTLGELQIGLICIERIDLLKLVATGTK
jgi:hypothetical protein